MRALVVFIRAIGLALGLVVGLLIGLSLSGCATEPELDDDVFTFDESTLQGAFLGGFFPIAADYQPHRTFDKWKRRGVNTVIRVPPEDTVGDWSHKAKQLDLKMIREPRSNPRDDKDEKGLLAWHWEDEPELHGIPPSALHKFRQRMRDIDKSIPIIVNFWGGGMRQANANGCFNGRCYPDYIQYADWTSNDIYPCNKFDCNIEVVGQEVSRLRRWADDKQPAFAYIETGDFDGNGSGPSPRRFRAEIWDAIIHGARGVFYFSARIKQNCSSHCLAGYDMTPNDVADEMKRTSKLIERIAPVLQRPINPGGASMKGPDNLEIGWRHDPSDDSYWFFVLNPDDAHRDNRVLELHGVHTDEPVKVVDEHRNVHVREGNVIVDDFDPYELHIYKVKAN